jgi:hypothetical protein
MKEARYLGVELIGEIGELQGEGGAGAPVLDLILQQSKGDVINLERGLGGMRIQEGCWTITAPEGAAA